GGKNAGGDRHAIMVNKSTCTLYELWEARYAASGSTAGSGAIWSLTSNRLRHAGWTSADAAGLPILPGLLNYGQVHAAARSGPPGGGGAAGRPPRRPGPPRSPPSPPTCAPPARGGAGARPRRSRRWAPGSG